MILKYSIPNGTPYLEFEDNSRLVFSSLTEDKNKGFKWISFSGKVVQKFKMGGKGKKKNTTKTITTSNPITFTTNMKLTEIPKDVKGKAGALSPVTLTFLKKAFNKLAPDGYFPRENLVVLEDMIDHRYNHIDLDALDDDPDLGDEDTVI